MAENETFICVHEKNNLPPLDPISDAWYQEAVKLSKPDTLRPWRHIVELYNKAIDRNHWKAMHKLAALYKTGWPGGLEKDTKKAFDLYQRMMDLNIPQGFYNMGAMIGNWAGITNPATDGLTYFHKAAQLGSPPALTELGKLYIYVGNKEDLGLQYTRCAAGQGYGQANQESGAYYKITKHNFPLALRNYQLALSQGNAEAAFMMKRIFNKKTPPHTAMWYPPNDPLNQIYNNLYQKLLTDPDLRFPTLMKDNPLPPQPTQGYDADRPDWKPSE